MFVDGYVIRAHRMALGMTQAELGYLVGLTGATISLLERDLIGDSGHVSELMDILRKEIDKRVEDRDLYGAKVALLLVDIYKRYQHSVPDAVIKNAKTCCKFAGRNAK